MSTFAVRVERLRISPHPNADRIELAQVGDYQSIVPRGQYRDGDLAAYIPEGAVVPEAVLAELGLVGKLAGSARNRVKAIRLRGVLSQGICYPAREAWREGEEVTELLGITKYEPVVPSSMSGEVYGAGLDRCVRYDIENVKRYPGVFEAGEPVVLTEKIHGTWCQIGLFPEEMADPEHGALVVSSKGLASKGLAFLLDAPSNAGNIYVRLARQLDLAGRVGELTEPLFVLGELFGSGVQDLSYGASVKQENHMGFRVFDVYRGSPGQGHYLDDAALDAFCEMYGLERVPVLYRGPYDREVVLEHTRGAETVSGEQLHVREGVIIRPQVERHHEQIGRVQLKSVSEDYLLREGGTEFT